MLMYFNFGLIIIVNMRPISLKENLIDGEIKA